MAIAALVVVLIAGGILPHPAQAQPSLPAPAYGALPSRPGPAERREVLLGQLRLLQRRLEAERARSRRLRAAALSCYAASGGFALGSGATLVVHLWASERGSSSGALWGQLAASFGIIGGLGAVAGTMLLLERQDLGYLEERIRQLDQEIRLLESQDGEEEAER